ncbi:MAG: GH116 family glycosyl-hydrolase [Armatimonadota bacterium]
MKKVLFVLLLMLASVSAYAAFNVETGTISNERWQSGVPLGGIGCGKLEILTDGGFGYYTGNHNWDRPTGTLKGAFIAAYAQCGDKKAARMLRLNSKDEYAGVKNIAGVDYSGWFPTADIKYKDSALPVDISLLAWSSLIPNNIADSALPAASFKFRVKNPNKSAAKVTILMSWPNMVGFGGTRDIKWDDLSGNEQRVTQTKSMGALVFEKTKPTKSGGNSIGRYALCTAKNGQAISYLHSFDASSPSLPFWSSFEANGAVTSTAVKNPKQPAGALASTVTLKPGETRDIDFVLVWHFPDHFTVQKINVVSNERSESTAGVRSAIDGDPATRWSTARTMISGDTYQLDLGADRKIARIVLDSKASPTDCPNGYKVELSGDGSSWALAASETADQAAKSQSSGILPIKFMEQSARFIRITQTGTSMSWFWSIHEMELYDGAGNRIPVESAKATAYLTKYKTKEKRSSVGHYYSRRFSDPLQIAEYVYTNRDRLLSQTKEWHNLVRKSSLPSWLKLKMINSAFSVYACSVLTRDGRFAVQESPVDMWGSTGTMDQRMAAHAFWTQMFPELDQSELRLFAQCQDLVKPVVDGRITHFNGNIHEVIGDPNVSYGITDWPDLSCSWVMQVLKLYKWTGDRKFLDDMWPHVKHAMAWLKTADEDGDGIPEGGSTYDYETLPRGAFVYNASCYLGALQTAIDMAELQSDPGLVKTYTDQFNATHASLMRTMWNGKFFIKHLETKTGKKNVNSFVAQLAGDWLSRLSASGRTLPSAVTDSVVRETIARHVKPFAPIPPMEVTPEGKLALNGCYVLQHEPYLGCEAIYEGYTDDGLEVIKRIYDAAWGVNHNPWHQALSFNAPSGEMGGLISYMTCPTTWHVLNALSGITLDLPANTLYVSPRTGVTMDELHMPVFLSNLWLWIDYVPSKDILTLKVIKHFGRPAVINRIAADGDSRTFRLDSEFVALEGAVLDLSGYIKNLVTYPVPKTVDYTPAEVKVDRMGISAAKWTGNSGHGQDLYAPPVSAGASFDGSPDTRWSTGASMEPGDWMTVDMHEVRQISKVVMDSTSSPNDFPRGCTVSTSVDGRNWKTVAELSKEECESRVSKGVLEVSFASESARFLKITQNGSLPGCFWSIHELYLYE